MFAKIRSMYVWWVYITLHFFYHQGASRTRTSESENGGGVHDCASNKIAAFRSEIKSSC